MADDHEIEITLKWQNGGYYEMTSKRDQEGNIQVVRMEENGSIATLWPHVSIICQTFFNDVVTEIGNEMAQPGD